MAPPEEITGEAAAASPAENAAGDRPISTVLIVIAMQTEALPLVAKFNLTEDTDGSQVVPTGKRFVQKNMNVLRIDEKPLEVFAMRSVDGAATDILSLSTKPTKSASARGDLR